MRGCGCYRGFGQVTPGQVASQVAPGGLVGMDPEFQKILDQLPKGEQEKMTDQDKVAVAAMGFIATLVFGPSGASFVNWASGGGGTWLQSYIFGFVPKDWKAHGKFDWYTKVFEPQLEVAAKIQGVIAGATANSYGLLLQQKGLWRSGPIPGGLLWVDERNPAQSFWRRVAAVDPTVKTDVWEWVVDKAKAKGYGKAVHSLWASGGWTVSAVSGGGSTHVIILNCLNDPFCVQYSNLSTNPSEGEANKAAQAFVNLVMAGIVDPLHQAYLEVVDAMGKALDAYAAARFGKRMPALRTSYTLPKVNQAIQVAKLRPVQGVLPLKVLGVDLTAAAQAAQAKAGGAVPVTSGQVSGSKVLQVAGVPAISRTLRTLETAAPSAAKDEYGTVKLVAGAAAAVVLVAVAVHFYKKG